MSHFSKKLHANAKKGRMLGPPLQSRVAEEMDIMEEALVRIAELPANNPASAIGDLAVKIAAAATEKLEKDD
jgi:hypothetical protein